MLDNPEALLRAHGLQVTAQRLAVIRTVYRLPHATADGITEEVRTDIGAISRQAVYDALSVLVGKGLVRCIQLAGSPALYEAQTGDNHHHVICRICGRTTDIDGAAGEEPGLRASEDSGYQIDSVEVVYWGRCPECLERPAGR